MVYIGVEEILRSNIKPKEKQIKLVEAVLSNHIPIGEFITFFEAASDVDKGTCADAMKHISLAKPVLLEPYIHILIRYINYPAPRVKWGILETIGNMANDFPKQAAEAIPYLLVNTSNDKKNTTVIKWCAAFALGEIAKYNPETRIYLLPIFNELINNEQNTGIKNIYRKAIKAIG